MGNGENEIEVNALMKKKEITTEEELRPCRGDASWNRSEDNGWRQARGRSRTRLLMA
jgi:hypothetical protein